jgi:Kdo2-lipid IVA lauroyltransferase/acyltransferase
MSRFGLALVWLLHRLPFALLVWFGRALGLLLFVLAIERRRVVLTNLQLCFPHWGAAQRRRVARAHFQALGRSLLEHGILWWASRERVFDLVRVEGEAHFRAVEHGPVILLAPHFVGLDMGGIRFGAQWEGVSVYSQQKDPVFDDLLLRGRTRLGPAQLFSRQEGIRPVARAIKAGYPFYYLPDMDFGARDSIFVSFFETTAATITGLSRLARLTGARVVPLVTTQLPGTDGYVMQFYPAWDDFPSDDIVADTRRMNAFIEARILEMPEQYYWVHKRFKTRPAGEASVY